MKKIKLIHVVGPFRNRKADLRLLHHKLGGGILLFNYHFALQRKEGEALDSAIMFWIREQIKDHGIVVTGGLRPRQAAQLIRLAIPDVELSQYLYVHREGGYDERSKIA